MIYIIYIYIWTHTSGLLGIFLATNRDVNELSTNCNHLRGLLLVYATLHSGTTDGQASGDHHNVNHVKGVSLGITMPMTDPYMVCHESHEYTPVMLVYIPTPWIRHGMFNQMFESIQTQALWNFAVAR